MIVRGAVVKAGNINRSLRSRLMRAAVCAPSRDHRERSMYGWSEG